MKNIKKSFLDRMLFVFLIVILVAGCLSVNFAVQAGSYPVSVNVENIENATFPISSNTSEQAIGGVYNSPSQMDFPYGLSVNGTEVVNNSGQYVGVFNGTTLTSSGAVSLGTTLNIGTNLTGIDGIISYTDSTATTTSLTNMLSLYRTHTGETDGAQDGIGSCIAFYGQTSDGSGVYEATTTAKICAIQDDTASTSREDSIDFYQTLDNGFNLSQIATFDSGMFAIGSSSPVADLVVNDVSGASTTQIILGEQGSSACVQYRVDTNGDGTEEIWYINFSANDLNTDHTTTTIPSWCN